MDYQIECILNNLYAAEKEGKLPNRIKLSTYTSNADLNRFRPLEKWNGGAAEHYRVMLEIAVAISRVYPQIQVELIEIDSAKYDDWLFCNNLADSEATRAAFISYDDDE